MKNFIVNYFSTAPFAVIYMRKHTFFWVADWWVWVAYVFLFSAYLWHQIFAQDLYNLFRTICMLCITFSQNFNKIKKEFMYKICCWDSMSQQFVGISVTFYLYKNVDCNIRRFNDFYFDIFATYSYLSQTHFSIISPNFHLFIKSPTFLSFSHNFPYYALHFRVSSILIALTSLGGFPSPFFTLFPFLISLMASL